MGDGKIGDCMFWVERGSGLLDGGWRCLRCWD